MTSPNLIELLPEVSAFLQRRHGLWIDGGWQPASAPADTPVRNPATGDIISFVSDASADDVDRAVRAARAAFDGPWRAMRPADREKCLVRLSELLETHGEALAQLETLNQGKSIHIARAIEVGASVEYVRYMAGWATKIEGSTLDLSIPVPEGARNLGMTLREPVGVVGAIVPWNFPLMIALWKLAPALACGCTVVLKPSEDTPLTALRLAELTAEAGIPPGVVNVVTGHGHSAGAALTAHPGIDKLTFTGSTPVGKQIGHQAIDNMTRFTLELGGKNPMIIMDDLDAPTILPGLMAGCFFNQGQVCAAASRLYIQQSVFDRVVGELQNAMQALTLGPGLDPTATLQPLVTARHRNRVSELVGRAREQGVEVVTGGQTPARPGYYFEPTLLVNAAADNTALREEIFGPVIAATPVRDLDHAIACANDTRYGLAASVWTRDLNAALSAVRRIKAGTVWVNSHIPVDPSLPFGGFKHSGYGREHGRAAIDAYTESKSVCIPVF